MVEEKMIAKFSSGKGKNYFISVISFFILLLILSQAFFGIGSYRVNTQETEDEDTAHTPVIPGYATLGLYDVNVDMDDPQGVSGSRSERGDVEYWALIIGISDYPYTENDLNYCDDDAIDIYLALITYHGWDPGHIVLLLDSDANGDNVTYWLLAFSQVYVDSNDVFLLTFSGHGTNGPDVNPIDELDGLDEYIVLYDALFRDDVLESYLESFVTDRIMVFLDACFSGGFIKGTSAFGEEVLVCRSLPSTEPVEIIDSFARDLDLAGFVVLTSCDDDEVCWESSALENGVFTYYFVEGIESGFPADTNTNGRISAEEAFNYASPRTTTLFPDQHPQLYDGVTGELEFTAFSYISINVDPSDIDFGTIYEGSSGTSSVTITSDGNVEVSITASIEEESLEGFYTSNLKMFEIGPGYVYVVEWNLVLPSKYEQSVPLELTIPASCLAGDKTAILVFWAVMN